MLDHKSSVEGVKARSKCLNTVIEPKWNTQRCRISFAIGVFISRNGWSFKSKLASKLSSGFAERTLGSLAQQTVLRSSQKICGWRIGNRLFKIELIAKS